LRRGQEERRVREKRGCEMGINEENERRGGEE